MPAFAVSSAAAADEKVRELQARIREMQSTRLPTKTIATSPIFAGLLPDGMMRAGAAYSVLGSTTLAMAMLSAPSAAGSWCAVVGVPEFGAQAAVAAGIDLERLVLVPDPGDQWLPVAAALVDVLPLVVLRPAGRISDADAGRLAARLRKREAALITLGDWPGAEASLRIVRSEWEGIGSGHGLLRGRRVEVAVESRGMRTRSRWVRIPGPDAGARLAELPTSAGVPVQNAPEAGRSLQLVEDDWDALPAADEVRAG
ncbi:hypothetical protein [Naasia aerilata]|uniref:Protein ImuA n=1 Tax=Naasia aerilata TaxID=1162966 RepID=A0ABN6XTW8_9MICO|nr:hypothetical protein [Naasia aerilata]BDZ47085.1 hypothetical protein GCM10025866_29940 [Naasia aerilata]